MGTPLTGYVLMQLASVGLTQAHIYATMWLVPCGTPFAKIVNTWTCKSTHM